MRHLLGRDGGGCFGFLVGLIFRGACDGGAFFFFSGTAVDAAALLVGFGAGTGGLELCDASSFDRASCFVVARPTRRCTQNEEAKQRAG